MTAGPDRPGPTTHLHFYGGKGGVGKTTCAAARAIAEARRGRRVLVLSTDPAHSLGDALDTRLSSRASRIGARRLKGELSALELNGPRAFARWLAANRQALGDALEHGTWLDRDDIDALLELSIPGVDELMALVEIARLAGDTGRRFDVVIIDTAPTGHALRLLAAPDTVAAVADALDALQQEHRLIRARFGRIGRPEAADRLIETIARQAHDAGALLQDPSRSAFHLVALPEDLAAAETEDALAMLRRARVRVAELIVNRVLPAGPPCPLCDPRRAAESKVIARLRRAAHDRPITIVEARVDEPRGVDALAALGEELTGHGRRHAAVRRQPSSARSVSVAARGDKAAPEALDAFTNARLLLFGGKGGVGKTTCSAAAAIRLAAAAPSRRVLLLSTDPAHSLGDVLGVCLGDAARPVRGAPANLRARELDASCALAARRGDIEAAIAEVTSTAGIESGLRGVGEILDLAPPGIDELLGVVSVVESLGLEDRSPAGRGAKASAERTFDLVVCDTAPTGHALRLLEMPDAAREWIQALLRVLLKYRELVRPGRLAQELVELSHAIRRLNALLHDSRQSRFITVTRAAEVPLLETMRLIARVEALSIVVPAVVVNATTVAPGQCPWCRRVAAAERTAIAEVQRRLAHRSRACAIIQTPVVAPPPRGAARLRTWAGSWIEPPWPPMSTASSRARGNRRPRACRRG